ncbi:bifunctional (p)ppGpp synthetase/guanosine-3',5'-bis(diphosphate) 3'-pyrophosphohydrolase [Gottschalkiaceae bacterium SANA]|nr:bifunctional (p)ppGpp synthetase/guanosine-3',5'-bis(diphosphate) 3'-pyrophosphohydrolase [Gottschalkiaceae bacterium SANA]
MELSQLLDRMETASSEEKKLIESAYLLAKDAYEGQKRNSGEDFIIHPLKVAYNLVELSMDVPTIIAGILHDIIEDTDVSYEQLAEIFGQEVADLVEGVTKLTKIQYKTKEERKAENLRKMVIAMSKDIRVIIIKLNDRLHNMRTLEYMSEAKKKEKATETLEIYAPIANRLGMFRIKSELEDLALKHLDPEGYYDLREKISMNKASREAYIEKIVSQLREKLDETSVEYAIKGRPKHFYSIYKKMVYQHKSFEEIFDLMALRVIVKTVKDCYGVLGIVHTLWKPLPGRFKDYIAMPKPNFYQSLHTTVIGPSGEIFEIQIRTEEMHYTAEYGIAAHWKYKEGVQGKSELGEKLTWVRQMIELQEDSDDSKEFMDSLKLDLFRNEVFVFTPNGDVINLPAGSTPVDFAYRVHSAVGDKCTGAIVDGRIVPLDYKLKNGNIIKILTSSNSNGPSRDWLKIAASSHAKNKIRQYFKRIDRDQNIIIGKDKIEREVKREGYRMTTLLKDEWMDQILKKHKFSKIDELYLAVGTGSGAITATQIVRILIQFHEELTNKKQPETSIEEVSFSAPPSRPRKQNTQGIRVKGVDNIKVRFSKCCNPVPGDEIVGYITRGRGVSVHRMDCPNLQDLSKDTRFIDVEWDHGEQASYAAQIQVVASDKAGLLSQITQVISEVELTVSSLNAKTNKEGVAIINMTVEIKDVKQLDKMMKRIKSLSEVIDVYRMTT